MEARDLKRVMEIWLAGNREAHSFVPATYWEANAPMVEEQLQQAEVFVCERDGVVQGLAGLQGDYLAGIFVAKCARSQGIGKQLLDRIRQGHPSITLHVYRKNRGAVAFYQREGFTVTAEAVEEGTRRDRIHHGLAKGCLLQCVTHGKKKRREKNASAHRGITIFAGLAGHVSKKRHNASVRSWEQTA